ncbi:hypothetical protein KEH57_04225 [Burkholderia cenocepacia]|uniref:hypothetical protein n=1 Tax=Burkholderia cenocepacia TaxID=95486 RepID=UPI001BA5825F|nr:hypothetical protein [Burkholderia cenocepacia]QUO26142.1 hypothetical protein KEH57_04225 [Burkholderia cenocepacia]
MPLDAFLPYVMIGAPTCPESIAQAFVLDTCTDFCTRSNTLRRRVRIVPQAGVRDYPIWPDHDEQIVRVNEVRTRETRYIGARDVDDFACIGRRFTIRDGELRLNGHVGEWDDEHDAHIDVKFTAAPTTDACRVDATLLHDWRPAIVDGTLSRLYGLPGYPFSAPQLSVLRDRAYAAAINRARVRSLKSDTGDLIMATGVPFV